MGSYTFRWTHPAGEVHVTGTFDNWTKSVRLEKSGDIFEKTVDIPATSDKILYKFFVDGNWAADYGLPCENDGFNSVNNVLRPEDLTPKAATSEPTFSVAPLPATAGHGNPITLAPGEPVPHPSEYTSNTVGSNVKLDEESYNRSDAYPGVTPGGMADSDFTVPPVSGTMIPESSLPMGSSAHIRSGGGATTTAELAGQVPLEPRGVPTVVSDSQSSAHQTGEASTNPTAVQEKEQVEEELLSKVPEAPATTEGTATEGATTEGETTEGGSTIGQYAAAGSAAVASWMPASVMQAIADMNAGRNPLTAITSGSTTASADGVPAEVTESYEKANESPEAAANPEAVAEKAEVERELLSEVPTSQETGESAPTGSATHAAQGVPEEVTESYEQAHQSPEASANPEAVAEKAKVERELLSEIPKSQESGEPAPTGSTTYATEGVPEEVTESYEQAHQTPEAAANPTAVAEKAEVEQELLSKIPSSEQTGEPAPTFTAATSTFAPTAGADTATTSAMSGLSAGTANPTETSSSVADRVFAAPVDSATTTTDSTNGLSAPTGAVSTPSAPTTTATSTTTPPTSATTKASATTGPQSSSQTPEKGKSTTSKAAQAAATAAASSSSSPSKSSPSKPSMGSKMTEEKKKKRQSFFGKLKDKLKG